MYRRLIESREREALSSLPKIELKPLLDAI